MGDQVCLFCGGNPDEPDHLLRCDGRQGHAEASTNWPTFEPFEHARPTDPETSKAAAHRVEDATVVQQRVVTLYRQHPEGLTDEELIALYARTFDTDSRSIESKASPRKRRSDLTRAGILIDSGARRQLTSGRRGVVWTVAA
jgi:hypothetical protein